MKRNENFFGTQSLSLSFSRKSGSRIRSFAARRSIFKLRASRSDLRIGKKRWIGNILFRDLARKQGILATGRRERRTREGGWVASERVFQLCFIPTFVDNHSPRDIRGYFPPLSLQGHRKGWKRKQSRARSSLNGTPSVVASHRYQTSRASCSRKSDASKSILALLVSREIDQI